MPHYSFTTSLGEIAVERAGPADVDAVLAILVGAGAWLTARGIDQWGPGSFTRERGAAAIGRGEVYVARLRGEIVATLRLQWSEEALWGGRPGSAGYVHRLAVSRAYAGFGIGLGLLRWAEAQVAAAGLLYLRLDCMASNPALRSYYLRAGFTWVEDVWQDGWHAALYERKVAPVRSQAGVMKIEWQTIGSREGEEQGMARVEITSEDTNGSVGLGLIHALTAELAARYPEDPLEGAAGYDPAAAPADTGSAFLVAWMEGLPVGCVALRPLETGVAEVKRMFVVPSMRGRGVARRMLAALEEVASDFGYKQLVLETGIRQPEAIRLYEKAGYHRISCYGRYAGEPLSVCFAKRLPASSPDKTV